MNASKANLLNAAILIIIGGLGAYVTQLASYTALIPVVGGLILLACQKGVTSENKIVAHIAVVVTLLMVLGIVKPFMSAMGDGDTMGMLRTGLMIITGLIAMVFFIKSFRDARKAREAQDA
ncbi:MAG: hypothetical protein V3V00_15030 [Saprospiraceae bacterium]